MRTLERGDYNVKEVMEDFTALCGETSRIQSAWNLYRSASRRMEVDCGTPGTIEISQDTTQGLICL